ncbi:uncharacterized protein PADG_06549 [Paracoccidioides brasiliensis Pb18]|uniref:Uncharacterized protein n=1 Tax=Paracoccidioides brasiliensis (strain Pb18) TaxID=502780 RepID=C1GH13_PARBD|nr:uncharacterized protein PADG_06549 [Paracoccidioides brasiliensis Pb18]EEH50470.1 hypothetical protein PADG_06549 [Paracoccidioides brasiliensis Pb18]
MIPLLSIEEISTILTSVDVVIVGNGPAAIILSYILHGHVPFYNPQKPHPDPLLHAKLKQNPQLLHLDIEHLTSHLGASRFSYSTQALPINVLLVALIRPNGDDDEGTETSLQWRYMPEMATSHLVFGDVDQPGGQWTGCPEGTTPDVRSLSYAGMLSLPGYSFSEHHEQVHGCPLPPFTRPSRQAVAEYLAAYSISVGISGSIRCNEEIQGIVRTENAFYIGSHNITCNKLILASYCHVLSPVLSRPAPLLVVGSGFSAADVIISSHPNQKLLHVFQWEPDTNPSPLRSCHQQAYPEYAAIYRLMKREFGRLNQNGSSRFPKLAGGTSIPFLEGRNLEDDYEGIPNTIITDVVLDYETALVTFRCQAGITFSRKVSGLAYVVGRQSTLSYLSNNLLAEIFGKQSLKECERISRKRMRARALEGLEVTNNVFIIGSLTGDSLIRFAYGGCIYAAGRLIQTDLNIQIEEEYRKIPARKQPIASRGLLKVAEVNVTLEYLIQMNRNSQNMSNVIWRQLGLTVGGILCFH